MTKQEYINRILAVMNETGMFDQNGNTLLGADKAQVDRSIEWSYVEAWRRCVKAMPRTWFGAVSFSGQTHVPNLANGTGYVVLPDLFYLLVSFQMDGWQKPVYEAVLENELTAAIQTNPYTRGSTIRPVCTITQEDTGSGVIKQVLNYYSLRKGLASHTITKALCIVEPPDLTTLADTAVLDLDPQATEPLIYIAASTVFTIYEKYDIAKALENKAVEMFPGLVRTRGTATTNIQ
jgi:hypothetical protein